MTSSMDTIRQGKKISDGTAINPRDDERIRDRLRKMVANLRDTKAEIKLPPGYATGPSIAWLTIHCQETLGWSRRSFFERIEATINCTTPRGSRRGQVHFFPRMLTER